MAFLSKNLKDYQLSAERGFLADFELDEISLPAQFSEVIKSADRLPALITAANVRKELNQLPQLDLTGFVTHGTDRELRAAMVRYSFLVQAYVWGEAAAPTSLPANLAVPMVQLADALDQAPLLPYSAYVLDNWARLDKALPITLDNIRMVQNFLGGQDENWFVLIHVAIEAKAGTALALTLDLIKAVELNPPDAAQKVVDLLNSMNETWYEINALFDRMIERCDPYIYYQRVRPYIHGWKNNPALPGGLIYEGVARFNGQPQAFCGQTGSQSSIVPVMDGLYGVVHQNDELREFLNELHAYRPRAHRRFIEDVAASSQLRAFCVACGTPEIRSAFNACVEQVAIFRSKHLEYAASYINKQAAAQPGNDPDIGTGGTPFMRYLKKHRDENRAQLI